MILFGLAYPGLLVDRTTSIVVWLRGSMQLLTFRPMPGLYEMMESGSWMIDVAAVLGEIDRILERCLADNRHLFQGTLTLQGKQAAIYLVVEQDLTMLT